MANPKILVVDDDAACILMVSAGLRKLGFEVVAATDGWDGLAQARTHRPDLVLLDVKMPQMDGWTFIGFLRNQKDFEKMPVIFLTGRTSDEDRKRGLELGADDYLTKPVDLGKLRASIQTVLEKRAKARAAAAPRPPEEARPKGKFGLKGRLDQLSLSALLSILGAGKRSGTLVLSQAGRIARVLFRDGRVETAVLEGSPALEGIAAMDALGKWADGEFAFSEHSVAEKGDSSRKIPKI
jgi:CheY-like chemotaxis protein